MVKFRNDRYRGYANSCLIEGMSEIGLFDENWLTTLSTAIISVQALGSNMKGTDERKCDGPNDLN